MTISTSQRMTNAKRILLVAVLILGITRIGSSAIAQVTNTLQDGRTGKIAFQSFTAPSMFALAREQRERWESTEVWGELSLPRVKTGRIPAMIISHGSGGVGPGLQQWVKVLNDAGVGTFIVDSFSPRGVKRTAEDQSQVPLSANLFDALIALRLISTHPDIDPTKIGHMGFSRGGEVSFRAALEPFRRAVIKNELKFALHIPVYAGCNQVYWSPQLTGAPILNLLGALDDYTMAEPCIKLAARYESAGAKIKTIVYPEAHHSWDSLAPVITLPNATSGAPCGGVRWEIDSWASFSEKTGKRIPANELNKFFANCVKRGVTVGRNEAAFQQSVKDIEIFVREVFRLN